MGTNITALIRDLLVMYANMTNSQAQQIADDMTAQHIDPVDWLVTNRGLTFNRGFDPANPSRQNDE